MGLLDTTSLLWRPLVGSNSSSSSKKGRDDTATATAERDTGIEREEASVEVKTAVKEPVEETESTDEMAGGEVDAESRAGNEDTRDDAEVVADATEEAEPEDEAIEPEPESESEVEVEVEVDGESEVEDEPEFEDEDEESDGAEVENEGSDDETADNADVPTVDKIYDVDPTYAKRLSGTDIETIMGLAAIDADEVDDGIDVSPRHVQYWVDRADDM